MDSYNKNRIITGLKVLAIVVWALLTIAVCCGVWTYCPEPAITWLAGALIFANGIAIYFTSKHLSDLI